MSGNRNSHDPLPRAVSQAALPLGGRQLLLAHESSTMAHESSKSASSLYNALLSPNSLEA